MSKSSSRLFFSVAVILVAGVAILTEGCRKMDSVFQQEKKSDVEAKFFNDHRTVNAKEKALGDFIKHKNSSLHFVQRTVEEIGYPRWDKAMSLSPANSIQTEGSENSVSVTYIPFVRDGQQYVNATMVIYTSSTDTSFSYIRDWQYDSYGFNAQPDSTDAKDIFHLFSRLNYAVFGITAFKILDHRLLSPAEMQRIVQWGKNPDSVDVYYEIMNTGHATATELLVPIEECTLYDVTVTFECPPGDGGGGCGCLPFRVAFTNTEAELCWFSYQYEECTTIWVETGGGGGGAGSGSSGGGAGSGGGSGGGTGGGGGGWSPVLDDPPIVTVDIVNNLTSPCFTQFVNAMGSTKLKNEIARLYQETFVGNGKSFNVRFEQMPGLTAYGQPVPGRSFADPTSPKTWVVQLNSNYANYGTSEYWGSIMLHEIIHGFIKQNSLDFNGATTWSEAHREILENWITQLTEALDETYNMTSNESLALAFGGLEDILKDEVSGAFLQNMIDWVYVTYGISLPWADSVMQDFVNGSRGTPCQ